MQVKADDGLPDSICLGCNKNLALFNTFRNFCLQNDRTLKLRLNKRLDIKSEEIFLDDLIWKNDLGDNLPQNVCDPLIDDDTNDLESSGLEEIDSKQNIRLIENINSPVK